MNDIERIRAERRKMEAYIREAVVKAVADFQGATGAVPSGVSIEMHTLDYLGTGASKCVVGDVRAHVEV